MARKREEFLIELSKKVLRYNKSSEPFKVLYDRLIDNKLKLNKSYDYVESLARLKELKVVSDKIISIIFKPQIKSVTNEVILRSELAGAISTESFIKTMRDVKLWKDKEGELTPEYVYSLENIDSIDTFENRFISMLVDEIHNELKLILLNLSPLVETLEDLYQGASTSFGKASMINDLIKKSYPYEDILSKFRSTKARAYKEAKAIEKKIRNIKESEFYRFTSKKMHPKMVVPTNVLLHNPLYSYCYRYYKENYQTSEIDNTNFDVYYYNYVVLSFFKYFSKIKLTKASVVNASDISLDENKRIRFNPIAFKKGMFIYEFKEDTKDLGFYVDIKLVNSSRSLRTRVNEENISHAYILTSFDLTENSAKSLDFVLKGKDANNVYLFVMNNLVGKFVNSITLSYYKNNHDELLETFFASLTLLFDCDLDLFKAKCPVCGEVNITFDGYNYTCKECGTKYSMNKTLNGEVLRVKNLRRI